MGLIEGLVVTAAATFIAVWLNDNFNIGGEYVEHETV